MQRDVGVCEGQIDGSAWSSWVRVSEGLSGEAAQR